MLEKKKARSGRPTVTVGGVYLHSPYDPQREAQRFVETSLREPCPAIILLLGAGLGYILAELRRRYPQARLLAVFYDRELYRSCQTDLPRSCLWSPGGRESLASFLRSRIHEIEAEGLVTVEWPASARLYPQQALAAGRAVAQLLKELRGSLLTTSAFGRRWLRNSLINFLCLDRLSALPAPRRGRPLLLAASGPSLEQSAAFISRHRAQIELWALPSAVTFLLANGLLPDLVVLTDPSFFAISHLHRWGNRGLHLAMPLSAATGAWRLGARVTLLSQDTPFERSLLAAAGIACPAVHPHGTVAASALDLALSSGDHRVIFAGLDFCYRDIHSHVRPNSFEPWLEPLENRLSSLHSRLYARAIDSSCRDSRGVRRSQALATYAGWFSDPERGASGRVLRLHPSPVVLPGLQEVNEPELARLLGATSAAVGGRSAAGEEQGEYHDYPDRAARLAIVGRLLDGWRAGTERIRGELAAAGCLRPFLGDPEQLTLSYFFDAAAMAEMRRTSRLRGEAPAVELGLDILERESGFFLQLQQTLVDGA